MELKRSRNEGIGKQLAVNLSFDGFSRFGTPFEQRGKLIRITVKIEYTNYKLQLQRTSK